MRSKIDQAFQLLENTCFNGGIWKNSKSYENIPNKFETRISFLSSELSEILDISNKKWAENFREYAFDIFVEQGKVKGLFVLELFERKQIGPGFYLEDIAKIKSLFSLDSTFFWPENNFANRALLGMFLSENKIGFGKIQFCEIPIQVNDDLKNWLSGSSFLKAQITDDTTHRTLRTALAVRSLRKDSGKVFKQGYYTACAAKFLGQSGHAFETIRQRLNLSSELLGKWLNEDHKNTKDPHVLFNEIIKELPFLRQSKYFESNDVKEFLLRTQNEYLGWIKRVEEIQRQKSARALLSSGEPLEAVASSLGVSLSVLVEILKHNLNVLQKDLERDVTNSLGEEINCFQKSKVST